MTARSKMMKNARSKKPKYMTKEDQEYYGEKIKDENFQKKWKKSRKGLKKRRKANKSKNKAKSGGKNSFWNSDPHTEPDLKKRPRIRAHQLTTI